ncbi:MAG: cupin domain-containing protein [Planctomycetes bacterium]|nr:cupin domain-containing protein [Planctomycetota bacterium]
MKRADMNVKSIVDAKRFDPHQLVKATLFESERLFCDVYCVSPGQEQRPHRHDAADKIYVVVEGCGIFRLGEDIRQVGEKNVVHVPAGLEHSVKNDSPGPLLLLVFMAPHPNYVRKNVRS